MKLTIRRVFEASVHVALGVRGPTSDIGDSKVNCARASLKVVHPEAIPALILVPPATLVLHPGLATRTTEQDTLSIVEYVHFVVTPPAQRL